MLGQTGAVSHPTSEQENVRLGVSLTTLLVLYTFFNQTSSSLPQTAYVKMIDVWFIFCTLLLFMIIMVHVIVECLEKDAIIRIGPLYQKQKHISAESLLKVVRRVLVPSLVFVFTCVYWAKLLT
ncbi:uncharacterized protein [Procambarus clarkii]|uniref:uncharacterized protein n=1 Tax=Procambarus clarkii TaxID=6728 RepID=UPI0037423D4B